MDSHFGNPFTVKPYEDNNCENIDDTTEDETEDETVADQSEDPGSCATNGSLSSFDAGVEIPPIESSWRQMRASLAEAGGGGSIQGMRSEDSPPARPLASSSLRSCLKKQGSECRRKFHPVREMTLHLPMRVAPLRKSACVSFNPFVVVQSTRNKVTSRGKESLWFQPADYSRMANKCHAIAKKVNRGEDNKGRPLCTRGLEHLMCPTKRLTSKYDGWHSVFNEQTIHFGKGQYDEEKIRMVYQRATLDSLQQARRRGMEDEQAVQRYLLSATSICNNNNT